MLNNDVLISIALLERTLPMLKENTRETIQLNSLTIIDRNISNALAKITGICDDSLVLVPLMEVVKLIEVIKQDITFVETDMETKKLVTDKLRLAMSRLYLFAGKFYETNEFTFTLGVDQIIKRIVDHCLVQGHYFGVDIKLKEAGVI